MVHWLLEEIGEPYEVHLLHLRRGENREPAYLAVNPMGKVPALRHGDVVVTESAAICLYLADAFPGAGVTVPVGDPRRGLFLKWLFFGPGVLEPAVTDQAFKRAETPPRGTLGYGDFETTLDVLARALAPGPYLLGGQFTAADVVIGGTLRWGMLFELIPKRTEFVAYVDRLAARPALQRAEARDKEMAAA
jgi:glutathione S-transferase